MKYKTTIESLEQLFRFFYMTLFVLSSVSHQGIIDFLAQGVVVASEKIDKERVPWMNNLYIF